MNDVNSLVFKMDCCRTHLGNVLAERQAFDCSQLEGMGRNAICAVLRSLHRPCSTRPLYPLFVHLLETDETAYVEALYAMFPAAGFDQADNALVFLDLISGAGLGAIKKATDPIRITNLLNYWIKAQDEEPKRLIFTDKIPADEYATLTEQQLIVGTDCPGLSRFTQSDADVLFRALSKAVHFSRIPSTSVFESEVVPDDILPRVISFLSQQVSQLKSQSEENASVGRRSNYDSYSSFELIKNCYWLFRKRYEKTHVPNDLERLHHIVWFVLAFLGDDPDSGIFRPYSEINSANSELLVDYLLINPKEHLALFMMHNRDAQYSSLSKYGMGFDGRESSGSSGSRSGLDRTLDDVPLVSHLIEPALAKLFTWHQQHSTLPALWKMLRTEWVKPGIPTSSLHPVVLRRACIAAIVRIAVSSDARIARSIFRTLEFLVSSSEGIPSTSDKVFCELRNADALFSGKCRSMVRRLIKKDIQRSVLGIPTNYFAFECLLRLIAKGDQQSERMLKALINNDEFPKRGYLEFDIIADIDRFCGMDSRSLAMAVRKYSTSPEWRTHASEYSKKAVTRFLSRTTNVATEISNMPNALDKAETDELRQSQLTQLANQNFIEFVAAIDAGRHGRSLVETFSNRTFIVEAISKCLDDIAKETQLSCDDARVCGIIRLLTELVEDPDPYPDEKYDNLVAKGDDCIVITGVRAHVCFAVSRLACLQPFFADAWQLTRRLLQDTSPYIKLFAFNPLIEVLHRRKWNDSVSVESIGTLWKLLDEVTTQPHRKKVLRAFMYVRDLSEDDAERVLNYFSDQAGVETLYVFYAVFRALHVETMGPFDATRFVRILEDAIDNGSGEVPLRILRTLHQVVRDEKNDAHRVIPFLLLYSKPQHASTEIVTTCRMIASALYKLTEPFDISTIRHFILNTERLNQALLKSSCTEVNRSWLHPLSDEPLKRFFASDRDGFYEYLAVLQGNAEMGGRNSVSDDLITLLITETDPMRTNQIRQFLEVLVEHNPEYFPMRQRWLDR